MQVVEKNWTYERVLQEFPSETRVELIDREIFMPPSPGPDHQRSSREFGFLLHQFVRNKQLGEIFYAPFDVILHTHTVVQPDIVFIATSNLPKITKRGYEGVPDLVLEIISPSTFYYDSVKKFRLYEQAGIPEYWLIEPASKVIEVFTLQVDTYELHSFANLEEGSQNTKAASCLLQGFEIEAAEIFGS